MASTPDFVIEAGDGGPVSGAPTDTAGLDELALRCEEARWAGDPGRCRWCDAPARTDEPFCGPMCQDVFTANHDWHRARELALTRDRECCARCGSGPAQAHALRLLLRALIPMGPVESARLWHSAEWWACQLAGSVEVVHRSPRPDLGYLSGCHHHLAGLETRCHRCREAAGAAGAPSRLAV